MTTASRSTSNRQSKSMAVAATLVAITVGLCAAAAPAQIFDFAPLGLQNSFETASNWTPVAGPPGAGQTARFNSNAFPAYDVAFNSSPTTNALLVNRGDVRFLPLLSSPGDDTYSLIIAGAINGDSNTHLTLAGNGDRNFVLDAGINFTVGDNLIGRLTIEDGGRLSNANGTIAASNLGGVSNATVRAADAMWTNSDTLTVGDGGNGTLVIEDAGSVSNQGANIAELSGSTGEVIVRGAGSMWTSSSFLTVGNEGDATLTIEDGGSAASNFANIADSSASTSEVNVRGAHSVWNVTGVRVGLGGNGTLTIEDGGSVTNTFGLIGFAAGSTGDVMVSGGGSTWNNSNGVFVGGNFSAAGGTGSLAIGPGGSVNVGDVTRIYPNGQVNLQGGTFTTITIVDSGGVFNWESGTVNLTDPAGLTLGTGGFQFANDAVALGPNQSLGVTGKLTIPGTGGLTMLGGDLNTGSAEVQAGGLLFLSGGDHDFATGLMNHSSVIFNSTTINGPVTSPAGSDMTILGNVNFNALVSGAGGIFGPGTAIFNGGHNPRRQPGRRAG